jgi:hypothetical protein
LIVGACSPSANTDPCQAASGICILSTATCDTPVSAPCPTSQKCCQQATSGDGGGGDQFVVPHGNDAGDDLGDEVGDAPADMSTDISADGADGSDSGDAADGGTCSGTVTATYMGTPSSWSCWRGIYFTPTSQEIATAYPPMTVGALTVTFKPGAGCVFATGQTIPLSQQSCVDVAADGPGSPPSFQASNQPSSTGGVTITEWPAGPTQGNISIQFSSSATLIVGGVGPIPVTGSASAPANAVCTCH